MSSRKRKRGGGEFGPRDVDKSALYNSKKAAWAHYFEEQRERIKDWKVLFELKQQLANVRHPTDHCENVLALLPLHLVQRMTECEKMFECPVCAEELNLTDETERKKLKMTTCGHFFCAHCLEGLPEPKKCPQCRTQIKVRI